MAHQGLREKLYVQKKFKWGQSPAFLTEFSQEVMKIKIRVIEFVASKDGYICSLILTMDEGEVDDIHPEFYVFINYS